MRFKKIPKSWLIHSVQLADVAPVKPGAFGKSKVTEGQIIEHVRVIEPKHALSITANNEQSSVSAVLIHQPGISTDCTFKIGEQLIFSGQLYEIVGVKPMYELTKLHHTEVELSYVYADKTGN